VIDVPDRPDIQVRLVSLEFFLRHRSVRSSACTFVQHSARNLVRNP
jgi:hypothetical protein